MRGNRHQTNGRTVGVPTQPKHKVPDLISTRRSLSWEDKDQNSRKKASKKTEKKKQKPEKERINLKNQNHKIEKKEKTTEQKGSQKKRVESQLLPRIPVTSTSRVFVQNASTR
jgi:seryl-tRNA synthetase